MRIIRIVVVCCVVLALGVGIYAFAAWRPALAPIEPPAAASFAPDLVARGAELAAIGNCDVCHTASDGQSFAGGRAVPTPFGTIYSTNITPDVATGIGRWSEAALLRALRQGVARDGSYLYPAFPYDHFTLVTDDDAKALYAFLMTRAPAKATAPPNDLPFPLTLRPVLYGWNLLFLHPGPYRADAAHDAAWNRGAYLIEGLGHCGACHTPRNIFGAEQRKPLAGGEAEGWRAYALDAGSPAPRPWTADAVAHYLKHGYADDHGVARGPMAEVVNDLRTVPDEDIRAMAAFIAAQAGTAPPPSQNTDQQVATQGQRGVTVAAASADSQTNTLSIDAGRQSSKPDNKDQGALIYAATCAGCHQGPRAMPYGGIDLALSSGLAGPTPTNLINVVLYGLPAAGARRAPIMPGFADVMDDAQLAALVRYLRAHFTDKAPWDDVDQTIRTARSSGRATTVRVEPPSAPAPPGNNQQSSNEAHR